MDSIEFALNIIIWATSPAWGLFGVACGYRVGLMIMGANHNG